MNYPACDSPRGFIEADMGLVGLLWCRTTCTEPNNLTKVQYHIQALPVLYQVKIGVLMYYPACDSPRGFIEADMGLVGLLWCRTTCTYT